MEGWSFLSKAYAVCLPLFAICLSAWIILTWGAVQDDSFIHLRYAQNLHRHHFITFDGVHPNYGASSLLYVSLLAALRAVTSSSDLPHIVASGFHLVLFAGLAVAFLRPIIASSPLASGLGLILLGLLCTPSAVRWLDDGMETSLTVTFATLFAWSIHDQLRSDKDSRLRYAFLVLLAMLAVLARVELLQLCILGFLMLQSGSELRKPRNKTAAKVSTHRQLRHAFGRGLQNAPLLLGGALAIAIVCATMHVPLPDTAIAKSHGIAHWSNALRDSVVTLTGALSFGIGLLLFWLLTWVIAVRSRGVLSSATLLANLVFPSLLAVSCIRGQEIQGVRYFAWTFFFSSTWNILEIAAAPKSASRPASFRETAPLWNTALISAFLVLLAVDLPPEAIAMHHVLLSRQQTTRLFQSQHLDVLQNKRGVASDIGYIGYFSRADLCDLAGLVNGRAAGRLSSQQRSRACMHTDPEFIFANASQLAALAGLHDLSQWQVCGRYDFTNVTSADTHYLIVRPSIAGEVCQATTQAPQPVTQVVPSLALSDVANSQASVRPQLQ